MTERSNAALEIVEETIDLNEDFGRLQRVIESVVSDKKAAGEIWLALQPIKGRLERLIDLANLIPVVPSMGDLVAKELERSPVTQSQIDYANEREEDTRPTGWNPGKPHPSHTTRISMSASTYDEICTICGATDIAGGGWGRLAYPCPGSTVEVKSAEEKK